MRRETVSSNRIRERPWFRGMPKHGPPRCVAAHASASSCGRCAVFLLGRRRKAELQDAAVADVRDVDIALPIQLRAGRIEPFAGAGLRPLEAVAPLGVEDLDANV